MAATESSAACPRSPTSLVLSRKQRRPMKLWKWVVGLFFVLVMVDGALRKWLLPGQSAALFVLKDVVLWGGFFLYTLRRSPLELPRPLYRTAAPLLIGGYIFFILLQVFNPRLPNLMVGAVGLKSHLAYVPLVVLLPAIIAETTEQRMLYLLWGYTVLVVLPLAALSVYQFYQPPSAWINQYVRDMGTIASSGGHVRVLSTFSYVGSHTPYLVFNAFLSIGVLLTGYRHWRRDLLSLGGILFSTVVVVLPMTGSRGPIVVVAVALAALLVVVKSRRTRTFRFVAVLLVLGVITVQVTGLGEGWEALAERATEAGDTEKRFESLLTSPIQGIENGGLFGYGAGSAHQAAARFVPGTFTRDWLPTGEIESPMARQMIELGAPGWILLIAMKATLLYLALQTVRRSRRPFELIVGATAFCMLLAKLPFPNVYNVVASAFYWGSAGAMLGVWSLQQVRRDVLEAQSEGAVLEVPA